MKIDLLHSSQDDDDFRATETTPWLMSTIYARPACDATFELIDAVLLTGTVSSFAELSLSPVFQLSRPSIYEALEDCRPSRQKLMKLYISCMVDNASRMVDNASCMVDSARPLLA